MKKNKSRYKKHNGDECSYKDFLVMLPCCAEKVQKDLLERLNAQPRPSFLCGVEVPKNLNALSYGTLDDVINRCLDRVSDINDDVRDALRISTYEIIFLKKEPPMSFL